MGNNSTYLLYEKTNLRIIYRSTIFNESKANDGGVSTQIDLRIEDSTTSTRFAISSGNFTYGTHYSVSNLFVGASVGTTRMRVVTIYNEPLVPCGTTAAYLAKLKITL